MRLFKFYFKSVIFKIISSNKYLIELYSVYFNLTAKKRFRSNEYANSAKKIISNNLFKLIDKELLSKQKLTLLDVGCGPDIFINIFIYNKYKKLVRQDLTDIFKKLNTVIINKSFKYFYGSDFKDVKKDFFINNNYFQDDFTKNTINKIYDLAIGFYVIERFTKDKLTYFLKNIKNKANVYLFVLDFTDFFFIDKWNLDYDKLRFNKLKYSKKFYKYISNSFIYQNRLRFNDYEKIFRDSGFEIIQMVRCNEVHEPIDINYFNSRRYNNSKIHKDFDKYSYEDLFTPKAIFILKDK